MADARHIQFLALIDGRQREFQIAVFGRVGRQFIGADRDVAPLKTSTDIPDFAATGTESGEVRDLAFWPGQPLTAYPFIGAHGVAIDTGKIELSDFPRDQIVAALDRGCGSR